MEIMPSEHVLFHMHIYIHTYIKIYIMYIYALLHRCKLYILRLFLNYTVMDKNYLEALPFSLDDRLINIMAQVL